MTLFIVGEKGDDGNIHQQRRNNQTRGYFLAFKKNVGLHVAQWLRIRLPMGGTRVRALVREDPACREATKPMRHNY